MSNQLINLLKEFNIRAVGKAGGLGRIINWALEYAENGFSPAFRQGLDTDWTQYKCICQSINTYDVELEKEVQTHKA